MINEQDFREVIINHRKEVEVFQWAVMNSIGSLVYAGYMKHIQVKQYPREHFLIPSIQQVSELLNPSKPFMQNMSSAIIDSIPKFMDWSDTLVNTVPELCIFRNDDLCATRLVLLSYIIPNVWKRIPEVISKKFQIGDPSVKGIIDEDKHLPILNVKGYPSFGEYVAKETWLQFIYIIGSYHVDEPIFSSTEVMGDDCVHLSEGWLSIDNPSAICPIYLDKSLLLSIDVMDTVGFVTGITVANNDESDTIEINSSLKSNKMTIINFIEP